jgi:hypothetical protein
MNKRNSLIVITSLTASFVALTAAFFSVTGIAKLFAGATLSVLIMASALEFGKIIAISFLYQYWAQIPKLLKGYLTVASSILMLITSLGIYGFLSGAYQATADQLSIIDQQTVVIELKKKRFEEELQLSLQERDRLSNNIQELTRGLATNQQQYRDVRSGQILTTTSTANRTALQRQINIAAEERDKLALKIEALSDSVSVFDVTILNMNMNNDIAAEIGPLRFISNLTGWSMDGVVNIFALLIVFVFDPLAVALVIAVNFLIKQKNLDSELRFIEEPTTIFSSLPEQTDITESDILVTTPTSPVNRLGREPTAEELAEYDDMLAMTSKTTPESIETLLATDVDRSDETEPYQVYAPQIATAVDNDLHDPRYFERPEFDWSKPYLWEHNPHAVRYYYKHIRPTTS